MSMSMAAQGFIPPRHPGRTSRRMMEYFTNQAIPLWAILIVVVGFIALVAGMALHSLFILLAGCLLLLIGAAAIRVAVLLRIRDKQYDDWLTQRVEELYYEGLIAHGLDTMQVINHVVLHSFVLPGSNLANNYLADQALMKCGKDQQWRFSINIYTFFFFTRDYLAVYISDSRIVNTLGVSQDEVFHYNDIVRLTTISANDTINVNNQELPYQVEHLRLTLSNSETVELSAVVKALPQSLTQQGHQAPVITDKSFHSDLNRLRKLLLSMRR